MQSKYFRFVAVFGILALLFIINCKQAVAPDTAPNEDVWFLPVIWVSDAEIQFVSSVLGPAPANWMIRVKNIGDRTLKYTITDDADFYDVDWLQITPVEGTSNGTPVEHIVSIVKEGLAAKDDPYLAKITIASNDAYNSPREIDVSLFISEEPPPEIWIEPEQLTFTANVGGQNPPPKDIQIKNLMPGTLQYEFSADVGWISVLPPSGSVKQKDKVHSVAVDITGLGEGSHAGTITVSSPLASNSPQKIEVKLNITKIPPPEILVEPNSLVFEAQVSGTNPATQKFKVQNGGQIELNYTATADSPWLNISPSSGTLKKTGKVLHTVSVDKTGMKKGDYSGTITVSDPNAINDPQSIQVTLKLTEEAPPPPPPPPSTDNKIYISAAPLEGGNGTIVAVAINVKGNTALIKAFGLDITFDPAMFTFVNFDNGSLTSAWGAAVQANYVGGGVVKAGGWGGGSSVPIGSTGTLIIVRLRVIGNGANKLICIANRTDDIVGMILSPACTTFTYK